MTTLSEKKSPLYDGKSFQNEVRRFAESIDCLLQSLPSVMTTMEAGVSGQRSEFVALLKTSGAKFSTDKDTIQFEVTGSGAGQVMRMYRSLKNNTTAYRLIHRSFLTSLISQYDAYLGRLLRLIYFARPEKLNGSEKQITFKELVQYSSIEEARERLIEREVDSVVRRSHEDQIAWLKDDLGLNVSAFIPELPDFIEIAQRRHLFVHCDGVVSAPYIKNCSEAGKQLEPDIVVGHQLEVSKEYLERAFEKVYAVGVKIGLALWLNIFKKDVDDAAQCVCAMSFDLIANSRCSLAINLLEFALAGKQKPSNEQTHRFIILNLAQSYKWLGNADKCLKILGEQNWSASSDLIKLGVAALMDDYQNAFRLMRKLGHDEDFKRDSYRDWPIFKELRKQPGFADCYREIYSEDFNRATVVATGTGPQEIAVSKKAGE